VLVECATVINVDPSHITVQSNRRDFCARCEAGKGCGGGLIGKLVAKPAAELVIPVSQSSAWAPGQRVELRLSASALLRVAAMVYLMPLAGLFAGALAGTLLSSESWLAVAGAMVGLILSIFLMRTLVRSRRVRLLEPQLAGNSSEDWGGES